ncbi:DKNYY domain-containing protein [Leptotrichia trevisanii]
MNIKGHLLKILLLFVLVGSVVNADIRVIPIYKINGNSVYYRTENGLKKLPNADAKTFEILGYYVAKDKNYVYYWDEKLNKIDPKTFEVVEGYYITMFKDKNGIYILTKESSIKTIKINKNIKNIDFNSFIEITNNPYIFKDKNAVYTLNTDDDKTVTVFSFEKNDYKLNKLNNINPKKFDMMELNYFKDDKNIFYFSDKEKMMKKIKNADIESFEIMNDDYAKDKNGEYYRGEKIRENRGIK